MNRQNKYGAKRTPCGFGHTHASKREAKRCGELTVMQKTGILQDLKQQPKFPLVIVNPQGESVSLGEYRADFEYIAGEPPQRIIEDTKGMKTPVYRLKAKLMRAIYGIEILET